MVIHEGQPVPEGFEPLPQHHFLIRCELIKSTRLDGIEEFGEVIVAFVEDPIQPAALRALPEFHIPILFESVFDDNPFSQQNKEKAAKNLHPTATPTPHPPSHKHSPGSLFVHPRPAPGGCLCRCRPELGSRLAAGHPPGLGLDAGEDDATLPMPGAAS